jgi:hypothetical protein
MVFDGGKAVVNQPGAVKLVVLEEYLRRAL